MDFNHLEGSLLEAADWVSSYYQRLETSKVAPNAQAGSLLGRLEDHFPIRGSSIKEIIREFDDLIVPFLTHWNHPGFMGYFNSSTSEPALVAELFIAAINSNGMNWKASPANTELEKRTLEWLSDMLGLDHFGVLFNGGALSNLHAMLLVRHHLFGDQLRKIGLNPGLLPRFYLSEQCHNSIHKALFAAGFGENSIVPIQTDEAFALEVADLKRKLEADEQNPQMLPGAIITTLGSTTSTALDPVDSIMELAKSNGRNLWVHIDAAHGGIAALHPKIRPYFTGWEKANSITVNPHKWMFMPLDTSILFVKDKALMKAAFSKSADYLVVQEDQEVDNYMDYGITLGRRFSALKLYFTLKYYGRNGLIEKIDQHLSFAKQIFDFLEASPDFKIMAPLQLSTICFQVVASGVINSDPCQSLFLELINQRGRFFLTDSRLSGEKIIRISISGLHVDQKKIDELIKELKIVKNILDEQYEQYQANQAN